MVLNLEMGLNQNSPQKKKKRPFKNLQTFSSLSLPSLLILSKIAFFLCSSWARNMAARSSAWAWK